MVCGRNERDLTLEVSCFTRACACDALLKLCIMYKGSDIYIINENADDVFFCIPNNLIIHIIK